MFFVCDLCCLVFAVLCELCGLCACARVRLILFFEGMCLAYLLLFLVVFFVPFCVFCV